MKKDNDVSKVDLIRADICSRPNAVNGKYKLCNIGLELEDTRTKDIFFLETLQMRADLADEMIAKAESQGKDLNDPKVAKELGEKIKSLGTPVHRNSPIVTFVFNSLELMIMYGIAFGIWGLIFSRSFFVFAIYGSILALIINILFGPVVAFQRTREKVREMSFVFGYLWSNLAIYVGILGLIVLAIRLIFFKS